MWIVKQIQDQPTKKDKPPTKKCCSCTRLGWTICLLFVAITPFIFSYATLATVFLVPDFFNVIHKSRRRFFQFICYCYTVLLCSMFGFYALFFNFVNIKKLFKKLVGARAGGNLRFPLDDVTADVVPRESEKQSATIRVSMKHDTYSKWKIRPE